MVETDTYNPHDAPFMGDVDEEGVPIALSREDILASAIHMMVHVVTELAPQYATMLDALRVGIEKEGKEKTYTRDEVLQLLNMLSSLYVKMVETQSSSLTEILSKIPKKEITPARPPSYIS